MNAVTKEIETLRGLAETAAQSNLGGAKTAIIDATRALKRIIARAETLPAEYERVEVMPHRGPKIEFTGRMICETEFVIPSADPLRVAFEVWETRAGAMVAVVTTWPDQREGFENVKALVVQPQDDVLAMRLEVMDFLEWHDRARSMVRKAGWDLRLEVD